MESRTCDQHKTIQRRFTKRLAGLQEMSYLHWLK